MAIDKIDDEKQKRLIKVLEEMSEKMLDTSTNDCDRYFKLLHEIYMSDTKNEWEHSFRHLYSAITTLVLKLYDSPSSDVTDTLTNNLYEVYKYCENNSDQDKFKKAIFKLYDHVALETVRCRHYRETTEKAESVTKTLKEATDSYKQILDSSAVASDLKNITERIHISTQELSTAKKDVNNLQNQVISVLGIFSAIIIAFFGGFSYFTSIFSNLHNLHICKALFFAALLGFILFNLIVLLLVVIAHLTGKPIYFSKFRDGEKEQKTGYAKIFAITNVVAICVMVLSITLYCCNFTPKAEEHLNSSTSVSSDVSSVQ